MLVCRKAISSCYKLRIVSFKLHGVNTKRVVYRIPDIYSKNRVFAVCCGKFHADYRIVNLSNQWITGFEPRLCQKVLHRIYRNWTRWIAIIRKESEGNIVFLVQVYGIKREAFHGTDYNLVLFSTAEINFFYQECMSTWTTT